MSLGLLGPDDGPNVDVRSDYAADRSTISISVSDADPGRFLVACVRVIAAAYRWRGIVSAVAVVCFLSVLCWTASSHEEPSFSIEVRGVHHYRDVVELARGPMRLGTISDRMSECLLELWDDIESGSLSGDMRVDARREIALRMSELYPGPERVRAFFRRARHDHDSFVREVAETWSSRNVQDRETSPEAEVGNDVHFHRDR